MIVNEKLKEDLTTFLGDTWLTYCELMPRLMLASPPGHILKKNQTLEKLWEYRGIPTDIITAHLKDAVKKINANELVASNPYYRRIKPQKAKFKDLALDYVTFEAGEIDAIEQEYLTEDRLLQVPVAVHTHKFKALSLSRHHRTWMSITPNEISTMKAHIEQAHGKVFTAGLGLGYFTYMCALKEEVESVTVIEGNPDIIEFFEQQIFPQFESHIQDKITIISSDYFDYIDHYNIKQIYDFAFIDIYYGGSDAAAVYTLSEEVLYHYEGPCDVHYWLEEGIQLRIQIGLAFGLYHKFIAQISEEEAFQAIWAVSLGDEHTFRLFAKMIGWVYRNVYTLGTSEEAFRLIFDSSCYKMLAAYTEHFKDYM